MIAGHLDHYTGPAVFFDFEKLEEGEPIYVVDQDGEEITFIVSSLELFKEDEAPMERIFGAADQPYLNLITCAGTFNQQNTGVFAPTGRLFQATKVIILLDNSVETQHNIIS